jgi:hypothetical protein
MEHDQLIGCVAAAGSENAASEIGAIADRRAAKTIPPVRHRFGGESAVHAPAFGS